MQAAYRAGQHQLTGGQAVNIQIIPVESSDLVVVAPPLEQPNDEFAPRLRAADLCL